MAEKPRTATSIATLAIAIGATAVFSIVEGVLLRPLPYPDADRLVAIWDAHVTAPGLSKIFSSYGDFETWRRESRTIEAIAGATWATPQPILTGRGAPKMVLAIPATVDLFRVLGVAAAVGRTFDAADLTRGCTVVAAHRFWQTTLESRTDAVGQTISLDDRACTVVGVMPATFAFYPDATEVWRLIDANREPLPRVGYQGVGVFARLTRGTSLQQAQAEVTALHRQRHEHDPHGAALVPMVYPLQGEFTWLARRCATCATPRRSSCRPETIVAIDWRVLAFAIALAAATAIAFGVVPALRASRADVAAGLKAGSRDRRRPHRPTCDGRVRRRADGDARSPWCSSPACSSRASSTWAARRSASLPTGC